MAVRDLKRFFAALLFIRTHPIQSDPLARGKRGFQPGLRLWLCIGIPGTPHWTDLNSVDLNAHGAVVRPGDIAADEGASEAEAQRGGDEEVIDAPPDVASAYSRH